MRRMHLHVCPVAGLGIVLGAAWLTRRRRRSWTTGPRPPGSATCRSWWPSTAGTSRTAGLDVELKPIVKSSDRMLALTQGGIQWTNTGVLSVIVEMAKGNDSFYWFANVDDSPGAEGLVVQPGINSVKDLKGKKIAVTLASGAEITLYYLLKEAGLALGDVRVVPMAANEMVAAFANKNIDAYCCLGAGLQRRPEGGPRLEGPRPPTRTRRSTGSSRRPPRRTSSSSARTWWTSIPRRPRSSSPPTSRA